MHRTIVFSIGELLACIFMEYSISSKLQNVVTNNAANFTKAFTLFATSGSVNEVDAGTATGANDGNDDHDESLDYVSVDAALQNINANESDDEPIVHVTSA